LMDHLRIDRAHLVGHSMGALIAANVAARHAARAASATLVAGPFYESEARFTEESARWVKDLESGAGLTNFLAWLFPAMKPEMAAMASAGSMKMNDHGSLVAVMKSLPKLAITALPAGDRALLVAGTGDPLHPLSVTFAKRSSGARLVEVAGADHLNVITAPDTVAALRARVSQ
jgi:pimeloyl-ACP methyl ester carboxylesterase